MNGRPQMRSPLRRLPNSRFLPEGKEEGKQPAKTGFAFLRGDKSPRKAFIDTLAGI